MFRSWIYSPVPRPCCERLGYMASTLASWGEVGLTKMAISCRQHQLGPQRLEMVTYPRCTHGSWCSTCCPQTNGHLVFTVKYLGLLAMSKILKTHPKSVQSHKDLILQCLDDKDESIRLRALDLLYGMVCVPVASMGACDT